MAALTRIPEGKVIAGVCTGLADYFKIDVTIVRIATVLLAVFFQVGWIAYIALWLILPEQGSSRTGIDQVKEAFNKDRGTQDYQQYPGSQDDGPQDPKPAA